MSEVDSVLKSAIKVLNSSSDGAEKIRIMLDEIIKARYGPAQMLINTLKRQYLAEEVVTAVPAPPKTTTTTITSVSLSSKSGSDDSNSMEVAYDMVLADGKDQIEDSDADKYKELEELFCATCGDVHTSIRNQLVECSDCHLLYHQECHRPPISDQEAQSEWQCSRCKTIVPPESVLTSSSSSSSSSPTVFAMAKTSSSSSPHSSSSSKSGGGGGHRKSGGSSSLSKSSSGNGSGSSKSGSTGPNMSNILSADKRLANMKKKAAKMQKTK